MEAFKALDLAFSALSCAISISSSLVRCSICFVRCSISRTGRQLSIDSHCRHRGSDEKGSPLLWEREACAGEGDVVIEGGRADRGRARGDGSPPIRAEPQEVGGQGPRDRAWAWRLRQERAANRESLRIPSSPVPPSACGRFVSIWIEAISNQWWRHWPEDSARLPTYLAEERSA